MIFLEMYESLRLDGLNHFEAMVEICNAIEEDFDVFGELLDDICDYVEENNNCVGG